MPRSKSAPKPAKDEFDSDTDDEDLDDGPQIIEDEDEDDSDFEDPDLIQVPGGGTSLQTLKNIKGGKGASGSGSNGKAPSSNGASGSRGLIGDPIGAPLGSTNLNSLLKRPPTNSYRGGASGASRLAGPSGSANEPIPVYDVPDDDSGLEILKVVPGNSRSGLSNNQGGMRQNFGFSQSLLNAQDPYSMLGGNSDLLKRYQEEWLKAYSAMQNGGFNQLLQSMSSGNMAGLRQLAGLGGSGLPASMNSYGMPSGGGILTPGGMQRGSAADISRMWMNNQSFTARSSNSMGMMGMMGAAGGGEDEEVAAEDEDDMGVIETYSEYWPAKLKIGKAHPDPVVQTASMASVEPPDVTYKLSLPEETIEEGKLSALQLESITYACQQHEQFLPNGDRAGFLIGDGAGVGKGRTIAGLIFENFCKNRKRAVWVSVSNDLKYDAERDLADIGATGIDVHFLSKMKYAKINSSVNNNVKRGVIYATYSALIGESQNGTKYKSRLKQLLHWCGEDFDGCIVFDECHKAKNLCPSGAGKPTKTGQTVLELQQRLPKARIVYASATGASEPKHMAYMVRLGIWGKGSPFRDFTEFLGAVEKRGVGAMEIVAMDMKLRGMYIARQLSFKGVGFRIDEVKIPPEIEKVYNESVDLWVDLLHKFTEAAELIDADKRMKKTMWGQYWSSHQRFFKYLCIASKVQHVVRISSEVLKMGKCVVIGLQSTGEARTMEAVEREGDELSDFVSTAKGVLQSLIEKHFPAPDRERINRVLGIGKEPKSLLDGLGINLNSKPTAGTSSGGKRKNGGGAPSGSRNKKRAKYDEFDSDDSVNDAGSDFEAGGDEEEEEEDEEEDEEEEEDDFNPFGSDSDEDDPWARKEKKKGKKKAKKEKKKPPVDPFAHLFKGRKLDLTNGLNRSNGNGAAPPKPAYQAPAPPMSNVDRACKMKEDLLKRIERLGSNLPPNTLDHLIDELGGPENVSEMTGRKGRVVQDQNGDVRYESRNEADIPLETLNLHEKDRFMRGEKSVAIISEAASSGISLQADRRVANRKRRVHMTLELPWSADRAIQQFGRTHRSNQVSAPEYVLLISELAGEYRFASIVAKRLESLGALTHGDRRATESRDLSRFNIDNKYGRAALETTFKAIMGYEAPLVKPPADFKGEFFKDIADGLVGVGLITQSEDMPGVLTLDKGHNDISKFLNRILGMKVHLQNALFNYFSDTLAAIISQAKRAGRYDQGILDVGLSDEDNVELVRTHTFSTTQAIGTAKIELHVLHVERGMSWRDACEKWEDLIGNDEGFYLSHQVRNNKKTAILAVQVSPDDITTGGGKKKKDKMFLVYRPNTGQQVKREALTELKKKYKKVTKDEAEPPWNQQFESSAKKCSHAYWKGNCKNVSMGIKCEIGLRRKTYNVLTGSVLAVWNKVEDTLARDGSARGSAAKMQVVRLKLENGKRIVGSLIPNTAMTPLLKTLSSDAEDSEEVIY